MYIDCQRVTSPLAFTRSRTQEVTAAGATAVIDEREREREMESERPVDTRCRYPK